MAHAIFIGSGILDIQWNKNSLTTYLSSFLQWKAWPKETSTHNLDGKWICHWSICVRACANETKRHDTMRMQSYYLNYIFIFHLCLCISSFSLINLPRHLHSNKHIDFPPYPRVTYFFDYNSMPLGFFFRHDTMTMVEDAENPNLTSFFPPNQSMLLLGK